MQYVGGSFTHDIRESVREHLAAYSPEGGVALPTVRCIIVCYERSWNVMIINCLTQPLTHPL